MTQKAFGIDATRRAWHYASLELPNVTARVADVMQQDLPRVHADDSLVAAATLLETSRAQIAAVVDRAEQRPIGVISVADVARVAMRYALRADELLHLEGGAPTFARIDEVHVAEALDPLICCSVAPQMTLTQAAAMMAYEDASYALVIDVSSGQLCGVVSARDIAYWFAERDGYLLPRQSRVETADRARVVMVIEDEGDIADGLCDVLELEGYRVIVAGNGVEALELLESTSVRPDVILLDLMMPEMDGWQFRREQLARPALASIPVVVVSAYVDRVAHELHEPAATLQKPISVDRLLDAVKGATRGSTGAG